MQAYRSLLTVTSNGEDGVSPGLLIECGIGGRCMDGDETSARWRSPLEQVLDSILLGSIGEGLRRCCNEHHYRITSCSAALVGSATSRHFAGLASTVFQLSDAGRASLNIVGPCGTGVEVDTVRMYCRARSPELRVIQPAASAAAGLEAATTDHVAVQSSAEQFASRAAGACWAARCTSVAGTDSAVHRLVLVGPRASGPRAKVSPPRSELVLVPGDTEKVAIAAMATCTSTASRWRRQAWRMAGRAPDGCAASWRLEGALPEALRLVVHNGPRACMRGNGAYVAALQAAFGELCPVQWDRRAEGTTGLPELWRCRGWDGRVMASLEDEVAESDGDSSTGSDSDSDDEDDVAAEHDGDGEGAEKEASSNGDEAAVAHRRRRIVCLHLFQEWRGAEDGCFGGLTRPGWIKPSEAKAAPEATAEAPSERVRFTLAASAYDCAAAAALAPGAFRPPFGARASEPDTGVSVPAMCMVLVGPGSGCLLDGGMVRSAFSGHSADPDPPASTPSDAAAAQSGDSAAGPTAAAEASPPSAVPGRALEMSAASYHALTRAVRCAAKASRVGKRARSTVSPPDPAQPAPSGIDAENRSAAASLRVAMFAAPQHAAEGTRLPASPPPKRSLLATTAAAPAVQEASPPSVPPPSVPGGSALRAPAPSDAVLRRECASVVFLGTGAAAPSKRRGCTGIYVDLGGARLADAAAAYNWAPVDGILLDCGEGTVGALVRRYGPGLPGRLLGLRCVWLSHLHADHHAGLCSLLHARAAAAHAARIRGGTTAQPSGGPSLPLVILASAPVLPVVDGLLRSLLAQGLPAGDVAVHEARVSGSFSLGHCAARPRLTSFPVRHCRGSLGVRLDLDACGRSVVFSGDTVPCSAVEAAARGATMLIHEATFADDMAQDAAKKNHSTVSGALRVVQRARPQMAVLTHLSQRYAHASKVADLLDSMDAPPAPDGQLRVAVPTILAFDGLQVSLDAASAPAAVAGMAPVYWLAGRQRDG